ncbi:hypothetical protein [Streptomyces sp. NRRL S-118]|uniref:hypothetical protein n=1 Tax=Streptomyces sp. NRRL S-118 TaxID=1463881 RepID=UPI0004CA0B41|nr:hypothetical protein [Streptomyces sp. NRRL S-118]
MTRRTRRRTTAVAAALMAVLAACGPENPEQPDNARKPDAGRSASAGEGAAGGKGPGAEPTAPATGTPSPRPSAPPAGQGPGDPGPRTKAGLERAILTTADVPGYAVGPMDPPPARGETPDEAACRPITALLGGRPEPVAPAAAYRQITGANPQSRPAVSVFLTSHGGQGAATVLNRLRTAMTACRDGFTTTGPTGPSAYRGVRELPPVKTGDDSLAFQLTADFQGDPVPLVFHVVRSGATVATFYTANFEGPATPRTPAALVTAQAAKLTRG